MFDSCQVGANQKSNPANTQTRKKFSQTRIFTNMEIAEVNGGSLHVVRNP